MPKPRSKSHIIKRLQTERRRLEDNLSRLSREDMLQPGVVGEWSVRDVLAHLADWSSRMPVWVEAARSGGQVEDPEPGLTWKQVDTVNQRIYEAHRKQPLDEVLEYFRTTYEKFMVMVEAMPEEEMLTQSRYNFTGKRSIYDWLNGYAAHDLWGKTKIRKWLKNRESLTEKPHC